MDEELQGGLNAITQPQPVEAPVAEESSKESLFKDDSLERLRNERLVYDKHLQKMIAALALRENRPTLDRELAAFGAEVGDSPYFATGFSKGVAKMADVRDLDQQKKLEDLKITSDILKSKEGLAKEDYLLSEELKGQKYMRDLRSKRLQAPSAKLAVEDVSGKPSARAILGSGSSSSYGSGPDGLITQDDIFAAPPSAQKRIIEDYKRQQEDIKIAQEGSKSTEINVPFLGPQKISIRQEQEISRIINNPQYQALPPDAKMALMRQYYADNGIGEVQYEEPTKDKTSVSGSDKGLETASQKEQRLKLEGKAGENILEADKEDRKYVKGLRDNSNSIIQSSDILYGLASNPKTKEAFGILQKGGVINALLGLAEEGIGGEALSIRIKGIEDATRKLKYRDSEGRPIDPNDLINAVRVANQQIGKLSLSFAQIYLKGQGAVSDFERKLVEDTIPNTKDTATSMMLKAELLKARAAFDRDMGRAAMNYINKDPLHRTIEQYKATDEYRSFVDKLDSASRGIMQTYFPDANVAPQSKPSSAPTGNYADIIQQEKERRNIK
jgi:hypothetical protein